MKKRRILIFILMILSLTALSACSKSESKDISNESADSNITIDDEQQKSEEQTNVNRDDLVLGDDVTINNDIFTEDFFKEIQKITFWNKGEAVEITSAEDIKAVYDLLAAVNATMYTLTADKAKFGYTIMDFTLSSKKVQVGLLSGDMIVDGVNYSIDKDVVDSIRKIALQSSKEN